MSRDEEHRQYKFARNRRLEFNQQVFGHTFPPAYVHILTQLLRVREHIQDKEN